NRNIKLSEAPSHGHTIIMHDASSPGAVNYLNLAREILQRNEKTRLTQEEKIIPTNQEVN
ncbi:MAG: chromosome partitioning protein ParA, partial [Flavobacteriales bacterium]|nr:chromosome partitioning protein ParA [Flavobacteriales bacterium]